MQSTADNITQRFVDAYRDGADAVMREHEAAMIACSIDELVACGIFIMQRFEAKVEKWEEWVSASSIRYRQDVAQAFSVIEAELIKTGDDVVELINEIKKAGFEVEQEVEFLSELTNLKSASAPLSSKFQRQELTPRFKKALSDHKSSRLEETDKPWS